MTAIRTFTVLLVFLLLLSCTVLAATDPLIDIFETALDEFYPLILEDSVQDKLEFVAIQFNDPKYADAAPDALGNYSRYAVPAAVFENTASLFFDVTAEELRQCNTPGPEYDPYRPYYDAERQMYICFPFGTCDDHIHILGYTPLGEDMYDVYYYPVVFVGYTSYGDLEKMRVRYDGNRVRLWTIDRRLASDDLPAVLSSKTTVPEPTPSTETTLVITTTQATTTAVVPTTTPTISTTTSTASVTATDLSLPSENTVFLPEFWIAGVAVAALLIAIAAIIIRGRNR